MKSTVKIVIVIALAVIIGFAFAACKEPEKLDTSTWDKLTPKLQNDYKVGIYGRYELSGTPTGNGTEKHLEWDEQIEYWEGKWNVTGLPKGNPNSWIDAQWATFYNAAYPHSKELK
ncbi:MAG: hypothetical protein FWC06_04590 [Treponema sp.]|nr:hypothetical protein [Treponema sp.]